MKADRYSLQAQLRNCYTAFSSAEAYSPVIGITANYDDGTAKLAEAYYKQVAQAGCTPMLLPPLSSPEALRSTLDHIDGLLLSGGADINPLFQGEQPEAGLGGICDERDLPELLITRLAYNRQMPILGICRGIQTLAVALGGRVAQDITPVQNVKHSQQAARNAATHTVKIAQHTHLWELFCQGEGQGNAEKDGDLYIYVNSFHHQAVAEPGEHLAVVATAPDGIVEAVESNEGKPVMAVQWHPECMAADGQPLFRWLARQAREYREIQQLHDRILTLDTHCDTPMHFAKGADIRIGDDRVLVDLHKMREGRLDATIMVAYLPQCDTAEQLSAKTGFQVVGPRAYADLIFDKIEAMTDSTTIAIARTHADLLSNKAKGVKSILLGIENGLALEGNPQNVDHFAQRGIVYITLCHNGDNDLCDSARGNATHGGVSPLGEQVIRRMNDCGLMVDLSHASEKSFYDALDMSATPIVCSHSSCRALCDHPRNLTDEQMRALARRGGVCQITAYPGFLQKDGKATIINLMEHLNHAVKVMGVDHVGLGTDFDGDGGVPGLANASELTLFTRQLLRRRYSEEDIARIWGGNFLGLMDRCQNSKTKQ